MSSTVAITNGLSQSVSPYARAALPIAAAILGAGAGGGIVAGLLGIVNPIGGILFGIAAATITSVASAALNLLCNKDKNQAMSNLLGFMIIPLHCVGAAAGSAALLTAVGFPVGFFGAGILGVASLVSMFVAGQLSSVCVLNR